jgi:peptide deformylase
MEEEFHDEIIEGFEAIVVQHECDHLDGILYVDRLKDTKLFGFDEEFEKAKQYPPIKV